MKKNKNSTISENDIIYKYLSKLHFNKKESFKFKNDGAILVNKNTHDMVVTNDTIVESVDFFSNDPPESIAQKIVTYNLSDISAMGAETYSYTLSLSLPEAIGQTWIKKFVNRLFLLQKAGKEIDYFATPTGREIVGINSPAAQITTGPPSAGLWGVLRAPQVLSVLPGYLFRLFPYQSG